MPRFDDTPDWKRRQVWDPVRRKLVSPPKPPTKRQLRYLKVLSKEAGMAYSEPATMTEASRMIQKRKAKARARS